MYACLKKIWFENYCCLSNYNYDMIISKMADSDMKYECDSLSFIFCLLFLDNFKYQSNQCWHRSVEQYNVDMGQRHLYVVFQMNMCDRPKNTLPIKLPHCWKNKKKTMSHDTLPTTCSAYSVRILPDERRSCCDNAHRQVTSIGNSGHSELYQFYRYLLFTEPEGTCKLQ